MFAIVECGGKQYKVIQGTFLKVEKLEVNPKEEYSLDKVLLISDDEKIQIGQPFISNAKVICEVVNQTKDKKKVIFKYKPKKGFRNKTGHRQPKTGLKVKEIKID